MSRMEVIYGIGQIIASRLDSPNADHAIGYLQCLVKVQEIIENDDDPKCRELATGLKCNREELSLLNNRVGRSYLKKSIAMANYRTDRWKHVAQRLASELKSIMRDDEVCGSEGARSALRAYQKEREASDEE